ncbi:D-Ala-D-Ala carboxypeptidase family metallohydrolase [Croceicoccus hydrothermalis]|uniref:D-Ala-D-Ala carboxypeptidase family metallohydrolase n=1 Tax=Croceicoccus hydrothermalis TaxID=2867964 RepID=UPI001EFAE0E7|nr:D-Ala-D-Ala carboxypeptidase family metallohydrolase [Croceicoccus hydrothermalis]
MKLSPHFSLTEFTNSATARRLGIANGPTLDHIEAMGHLCHAVLEPVREQFGRPVRITSGYRSPALSRAVGSSARSQHCKGQAADFEIPGVSNLTVATWIRDNLRFDQLILENYVRGDPNSGWTHCSYRPDRARHSVLTYSRRKYWKGLVA